MTNRTQERVDIAEGVEFATEHTDRANTIAAVSQVAVLDRFESFEDEEVVLALEELSDEMEGQTEVLVRAVNFELLLARRNKRNKNIAEQNVRDVLNTTQAPPQKRPTTTKPHRASRSENDVEDEDLIKLYLEDIGQFPKLTKEQEVSLAKMIERGRSAEAALLNHSGRGTKQQRLDIDTGIEAKKQFINSNLRLVVSVAKKYQNRGLPLLDLIQEGNLGLGHAVDKFKWEKGFKFSTYATWWIRQAVKRGIANTGRTVRLPVKVGDELSKVYLAKRKIGEKSAHTPSVEELAEETGLEPARVVDLENVGQLEPLSTDAPASEDSGSRFGAQLTFGDMAKNPSLDVQRTAVDSTLPDEIKKALSHLDDFEREVIELHFGLRNGQPCTLKDVAIHFHTTSERIRRKEDEAFAKLADIPGLTAGLRAFLRD